MKTVYCPTENTYDTREVADITKVTPGTIVRLSNDHGIGIKIKGKRFYSWADIEKLKTKIKYSTRGDNKHRSGTAQRIWFFDGFLINEYEDVATATIQEDIGDSRMSIIRRTLRKCSQYYDDYLGCTIGFGEVPQEIRDECAFNNSERFIAKHERRPGEPLLGGYCGILAGH